jgi:hypothetical protein
MNVCKNINDMNQYMNQGNGCRSTGSTLMNADSSRFYNYEYRSHSIFTLFLEC